mmetsp:Transcript_17649/g.35511  ORF Transcript_17649/g.35511 Transcript_17649/m.35511 type:complete len:622 (+) Transcript_17649:965-2830(+)
MESAKDSGSVGGVDLDVVADRVRWPDANDARRLELLACDDLINELEGIAVQLLSLGTDGLVVEDLGVATVGVLATQLPHLEEGVPVDVREQLLEINVLEDLGAEELGRGDVLLLPLNDRGLGTRFLERQELAGGERRVVVLAHLLVLLPNVLDEGRRLFGVEKRLADRDGARGVQHVHGEAIGHGGRHFDSGVHLRSRGAANKERDLESGTLHLFRDGDHLIERGRDQARAAEDVSLVVNARLQDVAGVAHHADVNNGVVVAAEHDADDILTNVVHVALDSGHEDNTLALLLDRSLSTGLARRRRLVLLLLHERQQVGHCLLHHTGRLDHLRQEHLAGAEKVADHVHARHEWSLNHLKIGLEHVTRLLSVLLDELSDALHKSVGEALIDRLAAPLERVLFLGGAASCLSSIPALFLLLSKLEKALDMLTVGRLVKDHLLDVAAHGLGNVLVDGHGASVDNAHGHADVDGVVEEDGMDSLTQVGEATEAEGQVGDTAGNLCARKVLDDPLGGADEILAIVVVLRKASGDGEDVGVEDDVVLGELHTVRDEDVVRTLAHAYLVFEAGSLAGLVESHDNHRCAVALDELSLLDELLLALLERDRVDNALALAALEASLDNVELG